MNVSKARAGALVMTESAAIASAAQRDCYQDLDVEEFEYVCTLDEVTCEVCGAMDGKHFPMSKYEIGVNVPPMHPNCRCATAPYFDDMDDWGADRAARDENGKTVYVPESMTYKEWKQAQKKVDNASADEQLTGKSVPEKYRKRTEAANNSENEVDNDTESGIIRSRGSLDYYVVYPERSKPANDYQGSSLLSEDLKLKLQKFEDSKRDDVIETALIITESGETITKTIGSDRQVHFTYDELVAMENGVLTHNHSNGTTFSYEDIAILFQTGLSEIRSCNSDGAYVMRLPTFPKPRSYTSDEVAAMLLPYEEKYRAEHFNDRVIEIDYGAQQFAVEQFAKRFHCDYYFERIKQDAD